jgi:hypothetical protein
MVRFHLYLDKNLLLNYLDSGSMNTPLGKIFRKKKQNLIDIWIKLGDISGPFDHNPTRWDELRQTVSIVVDIASVFDPDGVG